MTKGERKRDRDAAVRFFRNVLWGKFEDHGYISEQLRQMFTEAERETADYLRTMDRRRME